MSDITWTSQTNEHTPQQKFRDIDSSDPNEPYESGSRKGKFFKLELGPVNDGVYNNILPEEMRFFHVYLQMFSDGPKPKFIPSKSFSGFLTGYVFYNGEYGLGYYIDPSIIKLINRI